MLRKTALPQNKPRQHHDPPSELADFVWRVPGSCAWGDYELAHFFHQKETGRIRVLLDQGGGRVYLPLKDCSGLFRNFAEIDVTEDAVQEFVSEYGYLGKRKHVVVPTGPMTNEVVAGEQMSVWETEILRMRHLIEIWEAAREGDDKELSKFIHWHEQTHVYWKLTRPDGSESASSIASALNNPGFFARLRPGELVRPAFQYVQTSINEKLEEHGVFARLLLDFRDPTWNRRTIHIVPRSLAGCLWLQFAMALEGRDHRQCDNCRRWFEVGGSRSSRSDKRFCTPTCKAALNRKERDRAVDLRQRGRTVAQIAKELGKDIDTIRSWTKRKGA